MLVVVVAGQVEDFFIDRGDGPSWPWESKGGAEDDLAQDLEVKQW